MGKQLNHHNGISSLTLAFMVEESLKDPVEEATLGPPRLPPLTEPLQARAPPADFLPPSAAVAQQAVAAATATHFLMTVVHPEPRTSKNT